MRQGALIAPGRRLHRVLLPGDAEIRVRERRLVGGIPIPDRTWEEIQTMAASLNISI